jgi:hypothetical protein
LEELLNGVVRVRNKPAADPAREGVDLREVDQVVRAGGAAAEPKMLNRNHRRKDSMTGTSRRAEDSSASNGGDKETQESIQLRKSESANSKFREKRR